VTRSTYLSDHGPCAAPPVYKRPVFQQSSPKLDLILNINVLESSPSASPFPHLLHKPLRVVSSNTRDFYSFKVLATSSLLVQVVLSRPIEALTMEQFLIVVVQLTRRGIQMDVELTWEEV